jgi:hypothetical protein
VRPRAIHPYLFGAFPVLFLYVRNSDAFPSRAMVVPLAVTVLGVWLMERLATLVTRDRDAAALWVSVGVLLFFSYSRMRDVAAELGWAHRLGIDKTTLLASALLLAVGVGTVWRMRTRLAGVTSTANAIAASLVLISGGRLALGMGAALVPSPLRASAAGVSRDGEVNRKNLPDIYYILLDGHGRPDVLRDMYGYDSRPFVEFLRQRGFYVASRSRANYMQTLQSLASSLNFQYLDDVAARVGPHSTSRRPLETMIQHSRLVQFLHARGYVFIAFDAQYEFERAPDAVDVFLRPPTGWLNEFEVGLFMTTLLRPLVERWGPSPSYDDRRDHIRYTLEHLGRLPPCTAPRFVFAHVMAPHPPFVLGAHGEAIHPGRIFSDADGSGYLAQPGATREEYIAGYRGQVAFLDSAVAAGVDRILAQSAANAIVIVAGDHGPRITANWNSLDASNCHGCFGILNAYHMPGGDSGLLYPEISPVNSFRVVLDRYFGANLRRLPDVSYLSTWSYPYQWRRVATDAEVP